MCISFQILTSNELKVLQQEKIDNTVILSNCCYNKLEVEESLSQLNMKYYINILNEYDDS